MIPQPSFVGTFVSNVTGKAQAGSSNVPGGSLSNIPWRRVGVKYAANEVYFDIIEEIDAIVDAFENFSPFNFFNF